MWIPRREYMALVKSAAEGSVDSVQFRQRLNEAHTQIDDLKHQVELERARANAAVDAMLVTHEKPPITPSALPDPDTLFAEDPDELKRMAQNIADHGLASVLSEQ